MLAWCLLLGLVMQISAAEYEVDGQLEQTIFKQDGGVSTFHKSQFTVFVKDCAWLIRTTESDTNGKPFSVRETACINGTEIYDVAGGADGRNTAAGGGSPSSGLALIFSNTVPVGRNYGYYVGHLWEMFASGCYFAGLTNDLITPVYDVNASVDVNPNKKLKAKWELTDGPGSLPLNVTYFRDSEGAPIDATYKATGVTNAGTIKIPSGFVFEERISFWEGYLRAPLQPGQKYSEYSILKRVVATVTAVRPYCTRKDLTPVATGKTIVIDQRLEVPGSEASLKNLPYYVVQDGVRWLPLSDAKLAYVKPRVWSQAAQTPPITVQVKPKPTQTPPKKVSPAIIVVILLVPAAFVMVFWLLSRKRG